MQHTASQYTEQLESGKLDHPLILPDSRRTTSKSPLTSIQTMQNHDYPSKGDIAFLAILLITVCSIYLPALNGTVIFDDAQIINGGRLRTDLLSTMPRIATHVTYVAIDRIFNNSVVVQKIFNLVLHGLVVILLYFLTLRLVESTASALWGTSTAKETGLKNPARIGITLFALNPSAVYATAYLVQRSILLATIFTLLMATLFLFGLQKRKPIYFGLSFLSYAFAIMSKELAAMAIFVLPLLYLYIERPTFKHALAALISTTCFAAVVAYFFLRHYHISLLTPYEPAASQYLSHVGLLGPENTSNLFVIHLLNQMNFFFAYGLFWVAPNPSWMAIDLQPVFPTNELAWRYVPLATLFLLVLIAAIKAIFAESAKIRLIGTLVLIPMILFLTELLIVRIQEPFAIYRSYLWAISIPGLVALAFAPLNKRLLLGAGIAVTVLFTTLTVNRVRTFGSDLTIWSDAIEKSNNHPFLKGFGAWRPYINRGAVYLSKGDIRHALEDFHRADALGALHGVAQYNIGVVLQMLDQHDAALKALKNAESRNNQDPLLKYRIGESYYATHMYEEALRIYQEAARLSTNPDTTFLISTRKAEILVILRQFEEANLIFSELKQSNPNSDRIAVGIGMANLGLGKIQFAQEVFKTILSKSPNANAYYGLSLVYESQVRLKDAQEFIDKAIALEPTNSSFTEHKTHLSQAWTINAKPAPAPQPTAALTPPATHPPH